MSVYIRCRLRRSTLSTPRVAYTPTIDDLGEPSRGDSIEVLRVELQLLRPELGIPLVDRAWVDPGPPCIAT